MITLQVKRWNAIVAEVDGRAQKPKVCALNHSSDFVE